MTVTKPTIELRTIKIHLGLSEETPAYTAKLYVDGKHFADVSNDGHGGCDYVYPPKGPSNDKAFNAALKTLEASVAATYPKHKLEGHPDMDESLECLCHGLVWTDVDKKKFQRALNRKVIIRKDGKLYDLKGKRNPFLLEAASKKYGRHNVLNLIGFEAAWSVYNADA